MVNGNKDVVVFLVENGIDINIKNIFKKTAIEEAMDKGFFEISEFLIGKEISENKENKGNFEENEEENLNENEEEIKITEKDLEEEENLNK